MSHLKSTRPSTESSVANNTINVAPAQEQISMATGTPTEPRGGSSFRGNITNKVAQVFQNNKNGSNEASKSGPSDASASTSASTPATIKTSSVSPLKEKLIPGTSSTQRKTRSQTTMAGSSTAIDDDNVTRAPSKKATKSKKNVPTSLSKEISEEDRARYIAQSNRATFTIPPPRHKGPREPRPIKHVVGVETAKPVRQEPEPKPLPVSWHRQWNELRAKEVAAEEAAERAAEEAMPSFVVEDENDAEEMGVAVSSSVASEGIEEDLYGVSDAESQQGQARSAEVAVNVDRSAVTINKGKGKAVTEQPDDSADAAPSTEPPVVSPINPLRVCIVPIKDKGKGKAVTVNNETEEPTEASNSNDFSRSPAQISDDFDGSGEPTLASSSRDMSGAHRQALDTEGGSGGGSDGPALAPKLKAIKPRTPVPTNPLAKSLKKMPAGHEAIDEGLHNRSPVVIGTPQPEALTLVFKVGKEDPKRPGVMQHLANVTYKYEKEVVDWNKAKFIKGLNKWRSQILLRCIGNKGETRWKWTHGEMNALCDILDTHLKSSEINGSWIKIDWDIVAAVYNDRFEGVVQSAGELYARVTYRSTNGDELMSMPGKTMAADRSAPIRSSDGMRNQMLHFVDPRATSLVKNAKSRKKGTNSGTFSNGEAAWPANVPLRKIVCARVTHTPGPSLKRSRQDNEGSDGDDEKERPPTKKTKLDGRARIIRRGSVANGYNSNFDYADDSPTLGDERGHQFPDDSPFRLARNDAGMPAWAIRALKQSHRRYHGEGPIPSVRTRFMLDQQAPVSSSRPASVLRSKRSRNSEENDDDGEDNKQRPLPKKVKLDKRRPRDDRPLSVGTQSRRPPPIAPLQPSATKENQQTPTSNPRKRSRDEYDVGDSDNCQSLPVKRVKVEDLHPQPGTTASQNRPRPSPHGWVTSVCKESKSEARLPTLNDYLNEN